jgi:hypothetical protein
MLRQSRSTLVCESNNAEGYGALGRMHSRSWSLGLLPLRRAEYTNGEAVTESSSARTAPAGCLCDVRQQSICCPPTNPPNCITTKIRRT